MRVLDVLFPRKCVFCGKLLRSDQMGACSVCAMRLPYVTEPVCVHCGKPLYDNRASVCEDCRRNPDSSLDRNEALWVYRPNTKSAMMDYKYGGCACDAEYYADELVKRFHGRIADWAPDLIVPVPIHRKREWFRGYNQAALLAKALGDRVGLPMREALLRSRAATSQKDLDPSERRKNLSRHIIANVEVLECIPHDRVLLIDDVYTTGATMDICAGALKEAGAERVFGLCLCIGAGF